MRREGAGEEGGKGEKEGGKLKIKRYFLKINFFTGALIFYNKESQSRVHDAVSVTVQLEPCQKILVFNQLFLRSVSRFIQTEHMCSGIFYFCTELNA